MKRQNNKWLIQTAVKHVSNGGLAGCFSYPGVSCCLLTGLSVTPEARRNMTAGTFTFQRHALRLVKGNSTELLNGHRQCFSHRRLEINRCRHSSFTRTLFAFVCSAPELRLTPRLHHWMCIHEGEDEVVRWRKAERGWKTNSWEVLNAIVGRCRCEPFQLFTYLVNL